MRSIASASVALTGAGSFGRRPLEQRQQRQLLRRRRYRRQSCAIDHREARLKQALDEIKDRYDFVLIDCPPALSWLTIDALTAADKVVVVVSPGYFDLDSIVQIGKIIQEVFLKG